MATRRNKAVKKSPAPRKAAPAPAKKRASVRAGKPAVKKAAGPERPLRREVIREVPRPEPLKTFDMPRPVPAFEETVRPQDQPYRELPARYDETMIYVMVRDPHWIFAYWEVRPQDQERALAKLGGKWGPVMTVLRVYDVSGGHGNVPFTDVPLDGSADRWYCLVQPAHSYLVEIGLLHEDGRFIALARSNQISTPRSTLSDVLDEQWMGGPESEEIFRLSGGLALGANGRGGSQEIRRLLEQHLISGISSGSGAGLLGSMGASESASAFRLREKQRGFWFWLDCEVIVYGGTEPDAKVTFQGKPVKLRPDGTFSFRFALPDGEFVFDAKAESADGLEERNINPVVTRVTERPEPILREEEAED